VEKAPEAVAGDLQCASRERRQQAHVPGRIQAPSVHHSGERILRVDQETGWQAAVLYQRCGWRAKFRRPVGQVEEPRDPRARGIVHDHRDGCQCAYPTYS
jgi:nitrogen fixation protein